MAFANPTLSILVGPTIERSLLDVLLAPPPACQLEIGRIASDLETAASDLMAAVGLQKMLGAAGSAVTMHELDARICAAESLLIAAQNDDGSWAWTTGDDEHQARDRYATARVVWALSLVRKAGYGVPDQQFNKAVAWLQNDMVGAAENDYQRTAVLLHALSTAGKADFAVANRLYRQRQRLSPVALAYLALALTEMDRNATAAELLDQLDSCGAGVSPARAAVSGGLSQFSSDENGTVPLHRAGNSTADSSALGSTALESAELRAIWALAAEAAAPRSQKAEQQVDWLLAHRVGHRWSPDRATGPATLALARWFAQNRFQGGKYTLAVLVNDKPAARLEVDPAAGTQSLDVPAAHAEAQRAGNAIQFQITGRGRYAYQCI